MPEAPVLLAALVFGLGGGLLLYVAVRAERTSRETMSRAEAERVARRDLRDDE